MHPMKNIVKRMMKRERGMKSSRLQLQVNYILWTNTLKSPFGLLNDTNKFVPRSCSELNVLRKKPWTTWDGYGTSGFTGIPDDDEIEDLLKEYRYTVFDFLDKKYYIDNFTIKKDMREKTLMRLLSNK
jgi:hypothetical protein